MAGVKNHGDTIRLQCLAFGIPLPEPEYRFHAVRRWRFDFAWPAQLIALEIDGGVWIRGRHNRGSGFLADCEKFNFAAVEGWRIIRGTPQQLASGELVEHVKNIFQKN